MLQQNHIKLIVLLRKKITLYDLKSLSPFVYSFWLFKFTIFYKQLQLSLGILHFFLSNIFPLSFLFWFQSTLSVWCPPPISWNQLTIIRYTWLKRNCSWTTNRRLSLSQSSGIMSRSVSSMQKLWSSTNNTTWAVFFQSEYLGQNWLQKSPPLFKYPVQTQQISMTFYYEDFLAYNKHLLAWLHIYGMAVDGLH